MRQKPNIIYLAGTGRCGSTLLDMLLNTHPAVVTTGEIQIWPHEIMEGGRQPCGCGQSIPDCSFWQTMYQRLNPLQQATPQIHHFREQHNAGSNFRWPHFRYIYTGQVPEAVQKQSEQYGRNNRELFDTYRDCWAEQFGDRPEWIVDASKDPYRLYWLALSGQVNLKVIQIIRGPKSYTYSMTKDVMHGSGWTSVLRRPFKVVRKAAGWIINNRTITWIGHHFLNSDSFRMIRYEELATNPEKMMSETFEWIGLSPDAAQAADQFRATAMHTISGNPMRQEKRKVQLDLKWQRNLPRLYQRLVNLVTRTTGQAQFFGYGNE